MIHARTLVHHQWKLYSGLENPSSCVLDTERVDEEGASRGLLSRSRPSGLAASAVCGREDGHT